MQSLHTADEQSKAVVKICNELGEWFNISVNTKQSDPSSPSHFIENSERKMDGIQNIGIMNSWGPGAKPLIRGKRGRSPTGVDEFLAHETHILQ